MEWISQQASQVVAGVTAETPFAEIGLDSITAVELSHELERWFQVEITPVIAWNYPTPASMATFLARQSLGMSESDDNELVEEDEFTALLDEIEAMDDGEAEAQLRQELDDDK